MSRKNNRYRAARRRRRLTALLIACIVLALAVAAVLVFVFNRKSDFPAQPDESWAEWTEWDDGEEPFEFGEEAAEADALPEESEEGWEDTTLLDGMLEEPETPVVLAEFDGGTVMSDVFIARYNDELTDAVFSGEEVDATKLKKTVLSDLTEEAVQYHQAETLGLAELTDEDRAAIKAYSAGLVEDMVTVYMADLNDGTMSGNDLRTKAIAEMENEDGLTAESVEADVADLWWMSKLFDATVKDVTVTDDQIKAVYDALLEEQKQSFSSVPEEFEYAHTSSDPVVYYPAGYRAVKNLLIPISEEAQAQLLDLETQLQTVDPADEGYEALMQKMSAVYADAEATAQQIAEKLGAGESFEALADQYNQDPDSMEEPLRSEGYYVSADSFIFSDEFVQGSLELTAVGEVSTPLRSYMGVHLVQYLGELPEGAVPFEQVRDQLRSTALEDAQQACYDAKVAEWMQSANVRYHPENLK